MCHALKSGSEPEGMFFLSRNVGSATLIRPNDSVTNRELLRSDSTGRSTAGGNGASDCLGYPSIRAETSSGIAL